METNYGSKYSVMDWRAAVIAGLIAGGLTMLLWMLLWGVGTGGSLWTPFHHLSAIVLGEEVLTPSLSPVWPVVLSGMIVHLILAVFYTIILAFIIHRWGLVVGIIGGALFGLALYIINYYTFSWIYPWFYPMRSWIAFTGHIFFGAVAGGLYELLERDIYVGVEHVPTSTTDPDTGTPV
ncbi:MAG: hypothetical protein R6X18_06960 [Chloroflexota bacterium]|jgi:hypothetical protein